MSRHSNLMALRSVTGVKFYQHRTTKGFWAKIEELYSRRLLTPEAITELGLPPYDKPGSPSSIRFARRLAY
jgi:hypothetical protein